MGSRKPSIKVTDESSPPDRKSSATKTVVVLDHYATLPAASSAFREVMNELNPPAAPTSGCLKNRSPRRRKSSQMKHVHYVAEERVTELGEKVTRLREAQQDERGGLDEGEEDDYYDDDEDDDEEEDGDTQILHGMCHCYFVRNGTVTGLADQKCHHEHRNHNITYHPNSTTTTAIPSSSPRPTRKAGGGASSSSSSPVPDWFHAAVNNNHNHHHHDGNNKLPPLSPGSSSLLPVPDLGGEFRARSHSDTTAIARVMNSKRAKSLTAAASGDYDSPGARGAARGPPSAAGNLSPRKRGGFGGGGGDSPNAIRTPSPRRRGGGGGAGNHNNNNSHGGGGGLADSMNASLRLNQSPPPIVVQEATTGLSFSSSSDNGHQHQPPPVQTSRDRARRSSAHTIPTEQLHYLYDQFLHPSGSGIPAPAAAGRRPRSASGSRP